MSTAGSHKNTTDYQPIESRPPQPDSVKQEAEAAGPFALTFGTYLLIAAIGLGVAIWWMSS